MTEAEWLGCGDLMTLLGLPRVVARRRKLRLFVCACVRTVVRLLGPASASALEASERFADGAATEDELQRARRLQRRTSLSVLPQPRPLRLAWRRQRLALRLPRRLRDR